MFFFIWGKFLILLFIIYIFGTLASKSADIIAEKKGWSRAFMGVIFLAMITSFPELFTGISAVRIVKDTNMAMGEIFGSCIFNFFILALMEVFFRKRNIYSLKNKNETSRSYLFLLILIVVTTILISLKLNMGIMNVGISSVIILVLYLIFIKLLYDNRKKGPSCEDTDYATKSLKRETLMFIFSSLIIIAVGIYLPLVGYEILILMDWSSSFVGVVFLAFVTSFPELIVCISAARIGAFKMVFGNISGSNLFNLSILFFIDVFFFEGILLKNISSIYIRLGIIIIIMNLIVIVGIKRGVKKGIFGLISINGLILIILYLVNLYLSYN